MSEKSKWFRPKPSGLSGVQPLTVASALTARQIQDLLDVLERSGWLKLWVAQLFKTLAGMTPAHRLARNLKAAITQLADDSEHLFSEHERGVLARLDSAGVSTEHKETAQALLNVYERYQLTQALVPLFKYARSRKTQRSGGDGCSEA